MDSLMILFIAGLVIYLLIDKLNIKEKVKGTRSSGNEKMPYKTANSILTDAEISFYNNLKLYLGDKVVICPKVGLKDIFFIGKGVGKEYMHYFGKISQKHVDFLLCELKTLKPICGIELDDISHANKKSFERDLFIDKLYKDANFELVRFSTASENLHKDIKDALEPLLLRQQNETVILTDQHDQDVIKCPKCNVPMVVRKATKGGNAGKEFYGCINYPKCKEVIRKEY
jgi:hypothetical protein